ncbi:hypothetical protein FD755_008954 [Muntiacus reevesi]|uniref:Ig-like domain-containing protein n=1 Tax=Muntiacus reevesi TaxID=9886 RepID=A0A5J5MLW4_MUNRE|nr:hypothetical protein FD755_008954 [Muntiacus reevesi]
MDVFIIIIIILTLLGLRCTALWPIAAVEIDTCVLEAADGTDVRLNCTSSCFAPVGDALVVTWNFRPRCGGPNQFLQFDDNGTYTCQVKNPPDVDGLIREISSTFLVFMAFLKYETHLILLNFFQYYRWQVFLNMRERVNQNGDIERNPVERSFFDTLISWL